MFSPSPQLGQSAQPGVLARIWGAVSPAGRQDYLKAQMQGKSAPAAAGMGALGTIGQILQGFARGGR